MVSCDLAVCLLLEVLSEFCFAESCRDSDMLRGYSGVAESGEIGGVGGLISVNIETLGQRRPSTGGRYLQFPFLPLPALRKEKSTQTAGSLYSVGALRCRRVVLWRVMSAIQGNSG